MASMLETKDGVPVREGGFLRVEVIDEGIGIEPQHLRRIFNAFDQGQSTITQRFGGLGLGLAISKAMVEAHGGSLSVSSEGTGKGATFTVDLHTCPTPVEETVDGNGTGDPKVEGQLPRASREASRRRREGHGSPGPQAGRPQPEP